MEVVRRVFNTTNVAWCVYIACTLSFFMMPMLTDQWSAAFEDDLNVAVPFFLTTLLQGCAVVMVCNKYALWIVVCRLTSTVLTVGYLRFFKFSLFGCLCIFILTVMLTTLPSTTLSVFASQLLTVFSNNFSADILDYTLIKNRTPNSRAFLSWPGIVNEFTLSKYQGEDEVLSCTYDGFWIKNYTLNDSNAMTAMWSFNGKPLQPAGRHKLSFKLEEMNEVKVIINDTDTGRFQTNPIWMRIKHLLFSLARMSITTTLVIQHLQTSDFGTYRCSPFAFEDYLLQNFFSQLKLSEKQLLRHYDQRQNNAWIDQNKNTKTLPFENFSRALDACFQVLDLRTRIYNVHVKDHTRKTGDFHLNEVKMCTVYISVPVGTLLTYHTDIIHYAPADEDEDVMYRTSAERFINGSQVSNSKLLLSKCSKLWLMTDHFLTYFVLGKLPEYFASDTWWELAWKIYFEPDLLDRYINTLSITQSLYTESSFTKLITCHCLGTGEYGIWETFYHRPYFNTSTNSSDFVTVPYPLVLFVKPRRRILIPDLLQAILPSVTYSFIKYLFKENDETPFNSSEMTTTCLDKNPTHEELEMMSQLAKSEERLFHYEENFMLTFVASCLLAFVLGLGYCLFIFVDKIGCLGKRMFLFRPQSAGGNKAPDDRRDKEEMYPNWTPVERNYDIFISVHDSDARLVEQNIVTVAEQFWQQRVFFPPRDLPPGLPEMSATDRAIDHCKRFVVVISPLYLQDKLFEAENIVGCAGKNDVLVIVLDFVSIPEWLKSRCCVHDWTAFGTLQQRLDDLLAWIFRFSWLERWLIKLHRLFF